MGGLKRFSLPYGAGASTSGGRGKLLRSTSDLTRVEVLVRETLQNSWDAKLESHTPVYEVHVHRAESEVRATLLESVFTDLPASLDSLAGSLKNPDLRVMEIADRGTSGLDGPFRASQAAPEGTPNNFNSFVFDIGTTQEDKSAGGTFGFGKTATFEVSHAHSVVYWSACRNDYGEIEHRLIACSLHKPYEKYGKRFTGAHWWGDPKDEEIIPLRGSDAKVLGETIFKRVFREGETGTSILIIDPEVRVEMPDGEDGAAQRVQVRSDVHEDLLTDAVTKSIALNAWPKLVSTGDGLVPMDLRIFKRGEAVEITPKVNKAFATYATSLTDIRRELGQLTGQVSHQSELPIKPELIPIVLNPRRTYPNVPLEQFFGSREDRTVGYLHLMLTISEHADTNHSLNSFVAVPKNKLCLMRSQAELVVTYDKIIETDLGSLSWTGVFKPTPECDFHFASSEPPTHDSWAPTTAESEYSTYVVRRAIAQVNAKTREYLASKRPPQKPTSYSVRDVSLQLGNFVPHSDPPYEEHQFPKSTSRRRSNRRRLKPTISILENLALASGMGYKVIFKVEASHEPTIPIRVKVHALTSDGRLPLEEHEYTIKWKGHDSPGSQQSIAHFEDSAVGEICIETRAQLALDLTLVPEDTV